MAAGCWGQRAHLGPGAQQGCSDNILVRMASAINEELVMDVDGILLPSFQFQVCYFCFSVARVTLFLEAISPHNWGRKCNFCLQTGE